MRIDLWTMLKYLLALFYLLLLISCGEEKADGTKDMISERKQRIQKVLKAEIPVLLLADNDFLKETEQMELLGQLKNQDFFFDPKSRDPLLSEVLSITSLRPSERSDLHVSCRENCLRMELYNYALNGTLILTLDAERKVHSENFYPQMQGDLNQELANLAIEIAIRDSLVHSEYGRTLTRDDGVMQGTKTALNRTKCQRSRHLCAAPTFVKGEKALWVIVDLTDLEVAGTAWTQVGRTGMPVTERSAQNERMMREYCDRSSSLVKDGWRLEYAMTRSDGLKVYNIHYKGQPVVKSIKTVDWHVSYSDVKGFGYSDAIGCPEFSMAAVVAVEPPVVKEIVENGDTLGFSLVQKYHSDDWPIPCSYNYEQRFHFFRDGSFRPAVGSLGRGCGTDGTYRPVTRIAFEGTDQLFKAPDLRGNWTTWKEEGWSKESELYPYKEDKCMAEMQIDDNASYRIISNQGQLGDNSRGDQAWFYVTTQKNGIEGEGDLPTIGPCCNTDYRQGPEKFINGEGLKGQGLVYWYVPDMKNDGRPGQEYCWAESILINGKYVPKVYPCFSGPLLKYINYKTAL
ncbi:MAG TPA: hypothetical protein VJ917_09965 [Saprospiraceae bacterium]|nr:hypothetical protein [Saprospiraceae bacterium]